MAEIHCRKCGQAAQPADIFCRMCGTPLGPTAIVKEVAQGAESAQRKEQPVNSEAKMPRKLLGANRAACLIATVGILFLALALAVILFASLTNRSGGRPSFAIELVGTSTPYPTRRPYSTASFYETSIPYPTAPPYPTTGVLVTTTPTLSAQSQSLYIPYSSFGSCSLTVENQFPDLDSVVILADADTNTIVKAAYIRANDTFSTSGISTGTYDIYVALGLDWDSTNSRFISNPSYLRFEDPAVFTKCPRFYSFSGGWQYLTITLNTAENSGSDISDLLPYDFPKLSP